MLQNITVLFDATPLVSSTKSGVGYYTYQLIATLAKNHPEVKFIGHYFNFLGRIKPSDMPSAPNISYAKTVLWPGKILNILRKFGIQLPLELLFKRSGDLALFTNFVSLPSLSRVPRAIVVHDLCFLDFPEYVSAGNQRFLSQFLKRSINTAKLVITVSEFTKRSVMQHYNVADEKLMATTIPPPEAESMPTYDLTKMSIDGNFILFVGTLEPRKNIISLVKAYEKLPSEVRNSYSLVLAGGKGWYMEETMEYIRQLQTQGLKIILPGYVTELQRAALYDQASLFVLPSHYEGFGMPLLEAMSYGTPVAASDIEVFHEVAGEACLYFDKDNPLDIADKINQVISSPKVRKDLADRGKTKLGQYSWDQAAEAIFEKLLSVTPGRN